MRTRKVLPLIELRAPFTVARAELEALDRGAVDTDFDSLNDAARQMAVAENAAIFHGLADAGIEGIAEASSHDPIPLGNNGFQISTEQLGPNQVTAVNDALEKEFGYAQPPNTQSIGPTFGETVANWYYAVANDRADMAVELIDLREYPLRFLSEPRSRSDAASAMSAR